MQTSKIIQAVILMMLVALAASCTAGKIYSSRLFSTQSPAAGQPSGKTPAFIQSGSDSTAVMPGILTKPVSTADSQVIVRTKTAGTSDSLKISQPTRGITNGPVRTKKTRDD